MRLLLCWILLGSAAQAINLQAPLVPDPAKTPGDVLTSDSSKVCVPGYTQTVRNVPSALKNQIYKSYGITSRQSGEYEIDHLISLELGGSNSVRNLWPESFKTQPLNAHVKDSLENRLHELACSGKITLAQAQQAIASNWETAYVQYLGPLPGGKQPVQAGGSVVIPAPNSPAVPAVPAAQATAGVQPLPDGSCPANAPVKISKAGLFHLPQGDSSYTRTHAVKCFSAAQSAAAAGFRGVK